MSKAHMFDKPCWFFPRDMEFFRDNGRSRITIGRNSFIRAKIKFKPFSHDTAYGFVFSLGRYSLGVFWRRKPLGFPPCGRGWHARDFGTPGRVGG